MRFDRTPSGFPSQWDAALTHLAGPQFAPLHAALRLIAVGLAILLVAVVALWVVMAIVGGWPRAGDGAALPSEGLIGFGLVVVFLAPLLENPLMATVMAALRRIGANAFAQALAVALLAGLAHGLQRQSIVGFVGPGALFFVMAWQLRKWQAVHGLPKALWAGMIVHGLWNGVIWGLLVSLTAISEGRLP